MSVRGRASGKGYYVNGREDPMHARWRAMILRCHDPKHQAFDLYGARGITVCERWRDKTTGFEAFQADMGDRPSPHHSLDRIDNNGPYSPENCRWATSEEQQINTRQCRMLMFRGEPTPVAVVARSIGVSHAFLLQRMNLGWSDEDVINRPHDGRSSQREYVAHIRGEKLTTREAALKYGISAKLIRTRLNYGMQGEALIAPSARPYRFRPAS